MDSNPEIKPEEKPKTRDEEARSFSKAYIQSILMLIGNEDVRNWLLQCMICAVIAAIVCMFFGYQAGHATCGII